MTDRKVMRRLPFSTRAAVLACLFLCSWLSMAQPQTASGADDRSHPASALVERAAALLNSDPAAAKREAEAALALLTSNREAPAAADWEVRARLTLCDYFAERDRKAAEQQIALATALLPQAKRQGLRAGLLRCEGQINEVAGQNELALQYYDRAVTIASQSNDREMQAAALFSRGYLLGVRSQFAAGLTDLRRAESFYENLGRRERALAALTYIAILYSRMGDNAETVRILQRVLKLQRAAGLVREQGAALHHLGRAYEYLQQWDDARQAYEASLEIAKSVANARGEAYASRGLAAVANGRNDGEQALRWLDKASQAQAAVMDVRLDAHIKLARAIALRLTGRLPEGTAAALEALRIFKNSGSFNELALTHSELAAAYAAAGQWRLAYERQLDAQTARDLLFKEQMDQRFAALKVAYDTANTEKENALLLRENQVNEKALEQGRKARNLQTAVIALTVALALLLAAVVWHERRTGARMRELALTDELTGLPNRRAVLARFEPLLRDANASACALMIVDIDHFKAINDRHGHSAGDEALKHVATILRESIREPAFIGRLGGEEFAIVLPNANLMNAAEAGERLRVQVMSTDASRWSADGAITVSIGVSISQPGVDTPSTALQRADAALYIAKNDGRNCVRTELAIGG